VATAAGVAFKRAAAATLEDMVVDPDETDVCATFAAAAPFFLLGAGRLLLARCRAIPLEMVLCANFE
jgi:hypothetical protein